MILKTHYEEIYDLRYWLPRNALIAKQQTVGFTITPAGKMCLCGYNRQEVTDESQSAGRYRSPTDRTTETVENIALSGAWFAPARRSGDNPGRSQNDSCRRAENHGRAADHRVS